MVGNFSGTDGDDTIVGTDDRDFINGLGGNDTLRGVAGDDFIQGGAGDDLLEGGPGNDALYGGTQIDGLDGTDVLSGGDGDDVISAGSGDTVDGGVGFDTLLFSALFGASTGITADLSAVMPGDSFNIGTASINSIEVVSFIDGTDYNDVIIAGPVMYFSSTFHGNNGDDILIGDSRTNNLFGGPGNDTLRGGSQTDDLTGGPGNDIFSDTLEGLSGDRLDFAPGEDRIVFLDASLDTFTFNVSGGFELRYSSNGQFGSLRLGLQPLPRGQMVAKAAVGGGVELTYVPGARPANDFNGDGRSDVMWKHDNGTVRDWLGQTPDGDFVDNIDKVNILSDWTWHAVGTGDFNGDGRADILWKNDNGTVRDWLGQSDGTFKGNIDKVNILSDWTWHELGTGDFNGDGYDDILWQNNNLTVRQWLGQADGSFVGNIDYVNFLGRPGSIMIGAGDFNGDGRTDTLWQTSDGRVTDLLGQATGGFIDNYPKVDIFTGLDWHAIGTGDFNGDGRDDVLWRNDNGTIREWLGQSDGTFIGNIEHVNFIPAAGSQIISIGDFNGDRLDDLLWSNDGTVTEWLGQTDGSFTDNSANVNIHTGTDWHAQDPFVHDVFA